MSTVRSDAVSSFTIIKGSLIVETYSIFQQWDLRASKAENLTRLRATNRVGARSSHWLRDVAFVISRRFAPSSRDRPLVELAMAGCDLEVWKPLLLWHITRDEFLLRDFLINWLYPRYTSGSFRLHTREVIPYLESLQNRKGIHWSGSWTETTTLRVASGLLRIATDFGLLKGRVAREFASYHLPEASFLYLLHAMSDAESNARRIIEAPAWHMFLLDSADVEREILRLHQYRKLHYQSAGSLAQLQLPSASSVDFARGLVA